MLSISAPTCFIVAFLFPGGFGAFPGAFGAFPSAFGAFPDAFGAFPGAFGAFPGAFGASLPYLAPSAPRCLVLPFAPRLRGPGCLGI